MWRSSIAIRWLAPAGMAAALGCGSGDNTGPGGGGTAAEGRFTAELTGGFSQTLSGRAFYVQADDGLTIVMSSDQGGASGLGIVLARGNSALPAVGAYQVVSAGDSIPTENFMASSFWGSSGSLIQCFSGDLNDPAAPGGPLNITTSASNVAGDFTTKVACLDRNTGDLKAATITGQFNAEAGPPQ